MPSSHAILGPSSAHRWIKCPGSLRMSEEAPKNTTSIFAEEGTLAHTLSEILIRKAIGDLDDQQYDAQIANHLVEVEALFPDTFREVYTEMYDYAVQYRDFVLQCAEEMDAKIVLLERRVDCGVENVWGTADVILVSETKVMVIDLKYGAGVKVGIEYNQQLMIYGVGALDEYGDTLGTTLKVVTAIYQPRVVDGVNTFEYDADYLRNWREFVVKPAAAEALSGHGHLAPSESACRWCPAAGYCRARANMELRMDFGIEPEILEQAEVADILPKLPGIKRWCTEVEKSALTRAMEGDPVPGMKVVKSSSRREIRDTKAAIDRLIAAGYDEDVVYDVKLKGFTSLDKAVGGKAALEEILQDAVGMSSGSPTLAKEDDKRPAYNQAEDDFREVGE